MSKPYLAGLLLISPWALAAGGSWSSESFGGTMTRGQQSVKSKPLQSPSPLPPGARATTVHWNGWPYAFRIAHSTVQRGTLCEISRVGG
jgi:hypothetical protein